MRRDARLIHERVCLTAARPALLRPVAELATGRRSAARGDRTHPRDRPEWPDVSSVGLSAAQIGSIPADIARGLLSAGPAHVCRTGPKSAEQKHATSKASFVLDMGDHPGADRDDTGRLNSKCVNCCAVGLCGFIEASSLTQV